MQRNVIIGRILYHAQSRFPWKNDFIIYCRDDDKVIFLQTGIIRWTNSIIFP